MSAILLTAPAVEPVSLDEARAFLRVEHHDDDEVVAVLAAGACIRVEAATRRALITQSWRLSFDGWPEDGRIEVRPGPLQDPLSGDVAQWAMIVLIAYFGGRSIEKVARILARK